MKKSNKFQKPLPSIVIADTLPDVSYCDLFRFATKKDKIFIFYALSCALLAGAAVQFNSLCFGSLLNSMVVYGESKGRSSNRKEVFMREIWKFAIFITLLGLLLFILLYGASTLINIAAQSQVMRLRHEYFKAMLFQDIEYFEVHGTGDFAARLLEDVTKIEEAIGDRLTTFVYYQSRCIFSIIWAIVKGWQLALMCLITFPCIIILVGLSGWVANKYALRECEATARATSVAQEALSSIRTVYAFNGQKKEKIRYHNYLIKACIYTKRKAFFTALAMGTLNVCTYLTYSLMIRYGYKLIQSEPETYDIGTTLSIILGLVSGSSNFYSSLIIMSVFGAACGAGAHLFELIDRKPKVHTMIDDGLTIESAQGTIEFSNVSFSYPSRPDIKVLNEISVKIKKHEATAFVGHTGCGKSALLQLICRYYDVNKGSVTVDDIDVRDLSIEWLRGNIVYVFSEVTTFKTSVRENIRYGCHTTTDEEVQTAAEMAYAHVFIMKLPMGYDTKLGEGGAFLSGGQKQRLAIARALVRKPLVLLLDEATSQIDRISEDRLQKAILEIKKKCTVIIVATLFSSIQYADVIHVMYEGKVVESGSHSQLIALKGHYYHMISYQSRAENHKDYVAEFVNRPPTLMQIEALSKLYKGDKDDDDDDEDDDDDDSKADLNSNADNGNKVDIEVAKDSSEKLQEVTETESTYEASYWEVLRLSFPEWKTLTLATLCSFLTGFSIPILAIVVTSFMKTLYTEVTKSSLDIYSMLLIGLSVLVGLTNFISVTGIRLATVMRAFGIVSFGIILSFYFDRRVAMSSIVFLPLMLMIFMIEGQILAWEATKASKIKEKSMNTAIEAVSNIRTVTALARERQVISLYQSQLDELFKLTKMSAHYKGFMFGLCKCIVNFIYAFAILHAGYIVTNDDTAYEDIVMSTHCLIFGNTTLGTIFTNAPPIARGKMYASRIMALLRTKPKIRDPKKPFVEHYVGSGSASFNKVHFTYPLQQRQLLAGVNLKIEVGKTTAILGMNGNGKSTLIQLLERFYDPSSGTVCIDGIPLPQLRIKDVRRNIGLVQQECSLFHYRTVAENIAYGDNTRILTLDDIKEYAEQANIHQFIMSLPDGYNSKIGMKGILLSGGQKQRIAIARALIREPALLILDEATSALDMESEKLVQEALQKARQGRTCLMISHRLHTLPDADIMAVLHRGKIAEMGTFDELSSKNGVFHAIKYLESRHIVNDAEE